MTRPLAAALIAIALGAGCARTDTWAWPLTGLARAPSRVAPPIVLRGAPTPDHPFVELALVQARSDEGLDAAMRALQAKAAALGADAVVDVRVDEGVQDLTVLGTAVAWTAAAPSR